MLIDEEEFQKIDGFLKKHQFNLLNQLPKKIGNGQSNPTYILLDENGDKFILRTFCFQ